MVVIKEPKVPAHSGQTPVEGAVKINDMPRVMPSKKGGLDMQQMAMLMDQRMKF